MDDRFIDLVNILSLVVGLENLSLNEEQVNNLEEHLKRQDQELLTRIIEQNDEIIKLLKEIKNGL